MMSSCFELVVADLIWLLNGGPNVSRELGSEQWPGRRIIPVYRYGALEHER